MTWHEKVLRCTAVAAFLVYVAWNLWWLAQASLAPAMFKAITGLPAPTTGGTRSLKSLLRGNLAESLRFNSMTVPILALLSFCVLWLGIQVVRRNRLGLPNWTVWGWAVVLAVAWVAKLTGDPRYW